MNFSGEINYLAYIVYGENATLASFFWFVYKNKKNTYGVKTPAKYNTASGLNNGIGVDNLSSLLGIV